MKYPAVLATLAGVLLAAGCPGAGPAAPAAKAGAPRPAIPVAIAPVASESIQREVVLYGTLYGDEEATLSNKVAGRVRAIGADVGDIVTSGAPLCELELEDFDLAVTVSERSLEAVLARLGLRAVPGDDFKIDEVSAVVRARAQLANAQGRLARLTVLDKKGQGFVAEQTVKDAETEVNVATANLEAERQAAAALVAEAHQRHAELSLARRRRFDATIRTPEGPRRWAVSARLVSPGEYLKDGTNLFTVVASDPLKLRAAVPERYVRELAVGLPVRVTVEAWPDRIFAGTVSRLNPSVDLVNRTFGVEVLVPNPAGELLPHMFARGAVLTRREQVLLVPLESVVSFAGVTKVFAFDGQTEGKARERIVKVGTRVGSLVEVTGVEAGARVLVRGQTVVADGTAVVISGSGKP